VIHSKNLSSAESDLCSYVILLHPGWPSCGLRFAPHINETEMLERLLRASDESDGAFDVFTHDSMPERWHYSGAHTVNLSLSACG
jgi:hypothetical protein